MKDWFCRTFTPWCAAALFEDGDAWFAYLVRYDKVCNAIRVVLFAVAALMLIAGYAMTDTRIRGIQLRWRRWSRHF